MADGIILTNGARNSLYFLMTNVSIISVLMDSVKAKLFPTV